MKKAMYVLVLPLVVVSGLVFGSRQTKDEATAKTTQKPSSAAEREAAMKQWEATPSGLSFKQWEASPAGKKVYAAEAKISKSIREYTNIEAVVTSLNLPLGSRLGFGVMARIDGEDYILSFGSANFAEFLQLQSLKVNDRIIIRSHSVSHAPKYAYPIISGDYVEKDGKVVYQREPRKDAC